MTRIHLRGWQRWLAGIVLVVILTPIATFGLAVAGLRFAKPNNPNARVESTTICFPFFGARTAVHPSGLNDSVLVGVHEGVHARQCDQLGALRSNLRGVTNRGRLDREAEAFCAEARYQVAQGMSAYLVRERIVDEIGYGYMGMRRLGLDTVRAVFARACPGVNERAEGSNRK